VELLFLRFSGKQPSEKEKMKKKSCAILFGLPLAGLTAMAADSGAVKPNIILILADDMGYADASCFGGTAVPTPHIDALAKSGLRMTRFYSAGAVCTPARASIITGRYPLRFGIEGHFGLYDQSHLPRGIVTLPRLLRDAGYATAFVGKWHLGGLSVNRSREGAAAFPGQLEHGFEYYLAQDEDSTMRWELSKQRRVYQDGGVCLLRNDIPVTPSDPYFRAHLTDVIGDEAVRLVENYHQEKRPFFISVWHLVPHKPYEPGREPYFSQTAVTGISDDQHRFRSMMAHMDAKIGDLLHKLDELGIRDNTLILFSSDNGGIYEGSNGPLRAGKADLHEGGIRVPMIASWPGKIPAGRTSSAVGSSVDILPTFCAAAGVPVPAEAKADGINLLPHLMEGRDISGRGPLFWRLDPAYRVQRYTPDPGPLSTEAAIEGRWKLLTRDGVPQELFDLESDISETRNLLTQQPGIAAEMALKVREFLNSPRDTSGMRPGKSPNR
jgi:N-acetylgalactosamine-6-sulfatase